MHYDRGTWEPTVINYYTPDFCSIVFNENLLWFKYWFGNIVNREELQEKCITTKGVSTAIVLVLPRSSTMVLLSDRLAF